MGQVGVQKPSDGREKKNKVFAIVFSVVLIAAALLVHTRFFATTPKCWNLCQISFFVGGPLKISPLTFFPLSYVRSSTVRVCVLDFFTPPLSSGER